MLPLIVLSSVMLLLMVFSFLCLAYAIGVTDEKNEIKSRLELFSILLAQFRQDATPETRERVRKLLIAAEAPTSCSHGVPLTVPCHKCREEYEEYQEMLGKISPVIP